MEDRRNGSEPDSRDSILARKGWMLDTVQDCAFFLFLYTSSESAYLQEIYSRRHLTSRGLLIEKAFIIGDKSVHA
jgi:hypothetical protein